VGVNGKCLDRVEHWSLELRAEVLVEGREWRGGRDMLEVEGRAERGRRTFFPFCDRLTD